MEFRRTGQRDERRRRVMLDERLGSKETLEQKRSARAGSDGSTGPQLAVKAYHEAALADGQRRITDLIPTRFSTLLILVLAGIAAIAGIEVLYGQYEVWGRLLGQTRVVALDPLRPASLAGWFSSVLMAASSLAALMIYSIRRHREDDYRGRYRIWVWAAVVWLLGSMAAAAPMHGFVAAVIVWASGTQLTGNPAVFSTAFYAMLLVTVAIPIVVDMRYSRVALLAIFAAGVAYLAGVAIDLQMIVPHAGSFQTMCLSAARMTSHGLLLLSQLLFARHVYLDAQGLVAARPVRRRRRQGKAGARGGESGQAESLRVVSDDLGEIVSEPVETTTKRRKVKTTAAKASDTDSDTSSRRKKTRTSAVRERDEELDEPHVMKVPSIRRKTLSEPTEPHDPELANLEAIEPHLLTKAQRRRLRKLQRRSPRKAA